MPGGYSGKFLQRKCKIQCSRDNLGEEKVLKSEFFRLSERLKLKILAILVTSPRHMYWVYYKPPILIYLEVGAYETQIKNVYKKRP